MNRIEQLEAENRRLQKQIEQLRQEVLQCSHTVLEHQEARMKQFHLRWATIMMGCTGMFREFVATCPSPLDVHQFTQVEWLRLEEFKQAMEHAQDAIERLEQGRYGGVESGEQYEAN